MSRWLELRFECPSPLVDAVSGILWDGGCAGITENAPKNDLVCLQVTYENWEEAQQKETEELCAAVFAREDLKAPAFVWSQIKEENWKETHRRFYPPQPLSARFFLVPAWQVNEISVPQGYQSIVMEPGRAFGTGLHQSTRLALWLMEEYLSEAPQKYKEVLDVGTGSGILAIAARKMGPWKVAGIDIDAEAIEVAVENAALNSVTDVQFSTDFMESFAEGSIQMLVSNILLRTHTELLNSYARLCPPGGVLILSGLLSEQSRSLEPELNRLGFVRNRSKVIDEWESVAYLRR